MKFILTVRMDNDAFATEADRTWELSRILRKAASQVEQELVKPGASRPALDINGNTVGEWEVTP